VFARADQNGDPVALFVVNVGARRVRQITPTGTLFTSFGDWSPQGDEIVFSQRVMPDGRSSPESPDGKKIVFARGTSVDTDSNICTVNSDGTNLTQVTHGGRDQAADWGTHPLAR
jgi:Tol biopolymer transport system component